MTTTETSPPTRAVSIPTEQALAGTPTPELAKNATNSICSPPVRALASPTAEPRSTPTTGAPSGIPLAPANVSSAPTPPPPVLVDHHLAILAERVNDLEEFRKANANQLGALTQVGADKDGKERGYGLPDNHPAVIESTLIVDEIKKIEDRAIKNLQRKLKSSPLGPWVLSQKGIGEKTVARLLAATGDPYWNDLHGRPRTVSELWAYCGYKPGQRKQKGEKANWSAAAKMRAFNCIDPVKKTLRAPCVKLEDDDGKHVGAVHVEDCQCSPYRVIYDEAKAKYVGSVHSAECARCTGKGQPPAEVGSPRKPAHIDQMAVRYATKALLKNLWLEAKRLHDANGESDG